MDEELIGKMIFSLSLFLFVGEMKFSLLFTVVALKLYVMKSRPQSRQAKSLMLEQKQALPSFSESSVNLPSRELLIIEPSDFIILSSSKKTEIRVKLRRP